MGVLIWGLIRFGCALLFKLVLIVGVVCAEVGVSFGNGLSWGVWRDLCVVGFYVVGRFCMVYSSFGG